MGFRRKGREYALQVLFEVDLGRLDPLRSDAPHSFEAFWAQRNTPPDVRSFAEALVRGVEQHATEIDQILKRHVQHWSLDRMAAVDRNVLRVAAYELVFVADVPPRVILNEAIDIAKKYGSEESGGFVNGVLDHLLKTDPALLARGHAAEPIHARDVRR